MQFNITVDTMVSSPALLIFMLSIAGLAVGCACKHKFLPWFRTARRREILSKKKYKKLDAETESQPHATTYGDHDDDDTVMRIEASNQMVLKRVEYSSRELEQLKLLDAAIDDEEDDVLNSDSLNFPENDNMELTDNEDGDDIDDYTAIDNATNMLLKTDPHAFDGVETVEEMEMGQITSTQNKKSIFENDTDDQPTSTEPKATETAIAVSQSNASNTNPTGENRKQMTCNQFKEIQILWLIL